MDYFNDQEVEILYKVITNLLNNKYRGKLTDIDKVKDGKFIVERDPESGEYTILFVWWNDFGIDEETMSMKEMGNDIKEHVMPMTRRMTREVRGVQDRIEPDNDKYFFKMNASHKFTKDNYNSIVEDGELYYD